ncbi:hypothetical protein MPER_06456, partial [Moniliophthora perniciosa FA553]
MDSPLGPQANAQMTALALVMVGLASVALLRLVMSRPQGKPIPGPPGVPVLGNLLQLGGGRNWLTFTEWKKQYAGQDAILLNSSKVAADLLDRRAAIYSDRPQNIVCQILTGGLVFAFSQHNDVWRTMRRAAAEAMNNSAMKNYEGPQEVEATLLVHDLLKKPADWDAHLSRAANSLVLGTVYGMPPIRDHYNPDIAAVNLFVERTLHACAPGAFLSSSHW